MGVQISHSFIVIIENNGVSAQDAIQPRFFSCPSHTHLTEQIRSINTTIFTLQFYFFLLHA